MKTNKMKTISIWFKIGIISILSAVLVIFSGISMYYFIKTPVNETESHVGTVKSKSQDEITIKYGTKTELYLNIEFDDIGFKSIEATPTTYFGTEINERVSFKLHKERTNLEHAKFVWGFLVTAISVIGSIYFFLSWLFNFDIEE